ncbi:MAG: hypothetical protein CVT99_08335 [Bacteroidetes bacterium HGW-Bacteroidetes-16]|nr:MAG: hypothetical protein CVT99_08335 [Bacteroidetes bacterium HGW-Bacteroidetes-16]
MKYFYLYIIFFCLLSNIVYSQDTIKFYFDEEWNELSDSNNASFYRKAYKDNKIMIVNDYFIKSNRIQMIGAVDIKNPEIKEGPFVYYNENGQKSSKGIFLKNKKQGKWVYWYHSGNKDAEGLYSDGLKTGEWKYWFKSGQLQTSENYKDGTLLSIVKYFENGVKSFSGEFRYGLKHGKWTYWNCEGNISMEGNYKNGHRTGEWIRYFPEGCMKVDYKNDEIVGQQLGSIIKKTEW